MIGRKRNKMAAKIKRDLARLKAKPKKDFLPYEGREKR